MAVQVTQPAALAVRPPDALAQFVAGLRFEAIPEATRRAVRNAFLDTLCCGLFGADFEWSRIVNGYVRDQAGPPEATLWRNQFRGPAANVALGLGTMIHSFDF